MDVTQYGAGVFTVDGAASPEECAAYIVQSEATGINGRDYESAKLQTCKGERRVDTVRNNDRIIFDAAALASDIFTRLQPLLPLHYKDDRHLVGFNELQLSARAVL